MDNLLPKNNWREMWQYKKRGTDANSPSFFYYEFEPVWMTVGRISLHADLLVEQRDSGNYYSFAEYDHSINLLYDAAMYGDWLTRIKALFALEELVRFEPEFIEIVYDMAKGNIQPWSDDQWSESMIEVCQKYAQSIAYRIETYGDNTLVQNTQPVSRKELKAALAEQIKAEKPIKPPLFMKPPPMPPKLKPL